jgi:SnoaL-like polyketide cyclase
LCSVLGGAVQLTRNHANWEVDDEARGRKQGLGRELTEQIWNRRRVDQIPNFYSPDFVADYRPYAPERRGHDGIKGMVEGTWAAFPDYHEEIQELIAEGDRVVHLVNSGTQAGQWGPLPPTNKRRKSLKS